MITAPETAPAAPPPIDAALNDPAQNGGSIPDPGCPFPIVNGVCGNGGSATDASHFATELVVRFAKDRRALPAICLASDSGILTASANDYGFDEIFARQVAALAQSNDVLICLTTSGKSKNLIRALEEAKARKLKTIAFLGRDGGSTIGIADIDLLVKSDSTARVQEAHQLLLHVLCDVIESRLDKK